jgi:hypothetical protein
LKVLTFVCFSDAYRIEKGLVWVPAGRRACRGNGWVLEKGKGSISTGPEPHDNDPSAGSPTERLQRTEPAARANLPLPSLGGPDHILSKPPEGGPPTTIWPVNSIRGAGKGALGLGCGSPISAPGGGRHTSSCYHTQGY